MQPTVLIIDDEKKICDLLARIIDLEGFKVLKAYTGKEGLKALANEDVLVVISDVKLPDINGVELVKEIKHRKPYVEVINLTAYGTIQDGVRAIKNGAFDYITKGDDNEKVIPLVHMAMEKAKHQYSVYELAEKSVDHHGFSSILGTSKPMKDAIDLATKVASTEATVLLQGETGTGKEVFAQAIHYESKRRLNPFVTVNCSAFGKDLLESELFGYKAGAFTGATKDKKGLLEEANTGTLFLDEIGEMSLDLQSKLLRVLENQTFIKVGDTKTSKVDVRILAATNRNLAQEAETGQFRLDLFYRLSGFTINLPSLSQRKGDIKLIAEHYLNEFVNKINKPGLKMDDAFMQLLMNHPWKGNIRELKNVIERVVILAENDIIDPQLLPYEFQYEFPKSYSMDMKLIEKQHIGKVLNYTHGNKTETARLLGIGLTTLYRKLEEYNIKDF